MFTPEALANYLVTAVLTLINVLVGYLILRRFLFKPVIGFMRKREAAVHEQLTAAQQREEDAAVRLQEAERATETAKRDASALVSDARLAAQSKADAVLSQAKEEAAEILAKGNAENDRMRVSLLEGMRGEVADLSVRIASRVIGQYMDESRQREHVEDLIDEEMRSRGHGVPLASGDGVE